MTVSFYRGDTFLRSWTFKDGQNAVIDLSGVTARFYVRDSKEALLYAASTETGELVVDGINGTLSLRIEAVATKLWPITKPKAEHRFDLELTDSNGIVKTYDSNSLVVLQDQSFD